MDSNHCEPGISNCFMGTNKKKNVKVYADLYFLSSKIIVDSVISIFSIALQIFHSCYILYNSAKRSAVTEGHWYVPLLHQLAFAVKKRQHKNNKQEVGSTDKIGLHFEFSP